MKTNKTDTIIVLPDPVKHILGTLNRGGQAAYVVGGCVRDSLMGIEPADWDICTSATPDEIENLFSEYEHVLAGKKHGTVGIILDGILYEITTFRLDGAYSDGRHPNGVTFVSNLKDDLSRRDFTINAMAYNETEGLIDPFLGFEDLKKKMIRCVGNPNDRFREDYLRILRAIRFALRYRFKISANTYIAIRHNARHLRNTISPERVFNELSKSLQCDLAHQEDSVAMLLYCIAEYCDISFQSPLNAIGHLVNTPNVLCLRIAQIFGDCMCDRNLPDLLVDLRMPTKLIHQVMRIVESGREIASAPSWYISDDGIPSMALKRLAGKVGTDIAAYALWFASTHCKGDQTRGALIEASAIVQRLDECGYIYSISQLDIDGNDLIAIGIQGKAVGDCLDHLLNLVMLGKIQNRRDDLIRRAQETKAKE